MNATLKRTPLFEAHRRLGAKMVPFGGWEMPVQYSGVIDEHVTVRTKVGLFDVSHMGEVEVRGPKALAAVNRLITNDLERASNGQALYTAMCRSDGGIVDDLVVYRFSPEHIFICVNAANRDKDFDWIREHCIEGATATNRSDEFAQIAVQGPNAEALVSRFTSAALSGIAFYHFTEGEVMGRPAIISRTGYTGEDGFELYVPAAIGEALFLALHESGQDLGVKPAGLGARDSLRLEARMCLYGNDINDETDPISAGLGWVVKLDKADFIGREALLRVKGEGPARKLVGFEMEGAGIARHGYPIVVGGEPVGEVTSGTKGPTVGKAVGLGWVQTRYAEPGAELGIEIRGKLVTARVKKGPFYKRAK